MNITDPIGAGLMPDFGSMEIPPDFLNFVEDFNTPEELVMSGHFGFILPWTMVFCSRFKIMLLLLNQRQKSFLFVCL